MIGAAPPNVTPARPVPDFAVGGVGDPGTRLLSGPDPSAGAEPYAHHLARMGPLPPPAMTDDLRALTRESGLLGRGGGGFPLARKLEAAIAAPGVPLVVVNASESEPASRKDRTLCRNRPHLVLDGAAAAAAIVGADEVTVHVHRGSTDAHDGLVRAMGERRAGGAVDPLWRISLGPDRYVAGESSAIASLLAGGDARPRFSRIPMATRGPSGRPTVVSNAETMAHLGFLLRSGPGFWRSGGTPAAPGSRLLTLTGSVPVPGRVLELVGRGTIGEILSEAGHFAVPSAVLVGGYGGTWLDGETAWQTPFDPEALRCVGAQPGCGLIGVLPHGACGLTETARLVRYLADESAGQCGPCVAGLPAMADACEALARGDLRRRGIRRLESVTQLVSGGGACSHPDGAARLVRSALDIFEDDVARHLAGKACRGSSHPPVFSVPLVDPGSEWR